MDWGIIITLGVTIVGWAVTLGICKNKIDNNETRLARIEEILNKLVDNDNIINPIQDAPGQKMFEPAQQGSGAENRLP